MCVFFVAKWLLGGGQVHCWVMLILVIRLQVSGGLIIASPWLYPMRMCTAHTNELKSMSRWAHWGINRYVLREDTLRHKTASHLPATSWSALDRLTDPPQLQRIPPLSLGTEVDWTQDDSADRLMLLLKIRWAKSFTPRGIISTQIHQFRMRKRLNWRDGSEAQTKGHSLWNWKSKVHVSGKKFWK